MEPVTSTPLTLEPLPHPAAPLVPLFPDWVATVAWLGLFALLLALWFWARRRMRPRPAPLPAGPPAPPPPPPPRAGVEARIREIRREGCRTGEFRAGCHALSALMRSHLQGRLGKRLETLAAEEMGPVLGDPVTAGYFLDLELLQFGRDEPGGEAFIGACNRSVEIARAPGPRRLP